MVDKVRILEGALGSHIISEDVGVEMARCVALRSHRATCRQCVEVCPVSAISVEARSVSIDQSSCTHCGACVTACPTQALSSSWLPWKDLLSDALRLVGPSEGKPVIACSKAFGDKADARKVYAIECLERVDEALLFALLAAGARSVRLASGDCSTCETGCFGAVWTLVVEYVNDAMAVLGLPEGEGCGADEPPVTALSEMPSDAIAGEGDVAAGLSRRDLLGGFRERATRTFGGVVTEIADDDRYQGIVRMLGLASESADGSLAQATRPQVCAWALGALATAKRKNENSFEGQDAVGEASNPYADEVVPSRVFATVEIDGSVCTSCFLCTTYCSAHAIEKLMDGPRVLGFKLSPWLCNQCGACVDVCRPGALKLNAGIPIGVLLGGQPASVLYEDWS